MGGIFKSTRSTPKRLQTRTSTRVSTGVVTPLVYNGSYAWNDSQTTTSYRSRGRRGDEEILPTNAREFLYLQQEEGNFKKASYDIGHEFSTEKYTRDGGFQDGGYIDYYHNGSGTGSPDRVERISHVRTTNEYRHNGVRRRCEADVDPSWFITTNDIASGKQLINAAAPNRPESQSAIFLGEILLGGLPALSALYQLRDRASALRSVGSEYLNVQFGWLPFVSDIQKIVKALLNANKILSEYADGSGTFIRRRRSLPDLTVSYLFEGTESFGGNAAFTQGYRPDGSLISSSSGGFVASVPSASLVVSVTAEQKRWFSGAFTYYVPEGGKGLFSDLSRFEAFANKLLGTRLTPEVLWELAPWSWLIDWFFGIQSNISVATRMSEDGLVLHYGYLMVQDRVTVSSLFNVRYIYDDFAHTRDRAAFTRISLLRKRRVKSTPFGFGISPGSFTARQWSILAALGMTRGPRTLR